MDTETDPFEENTMRGMTMGLARIEWARGLLARIEQDPASKKLEYEDRVGIYRNEDGTNLYHFLVTRCLYSSTRLAQSLMPVFKAGVGSIPAEVLLRSMLVASAKALYLVMPEDRDQREARMKHVYAADRSALDHATNKELKLLGQRSDEKRPQGAGDSEIIRKVLDDLVLLGNCQCGEDGCPQYDLESIRHRILRLWWLYSSVAHVNIWHIEKANETAPSGQTTTTGNMGDALYNLGWLHAQAVSFYARRYDMLEYDDGLDWTRLSEDLGWQ